MELSLRPDPRSTHVNKTRRTTRTNWREPFPLVDGWSHKHTEDPRRSTLHTTDFCHKCDTDEEETVETKTAVDGCKRKRGSERCHATSHGRGKRAFGRRRRYRRVLVERWDGRFVHRTCICIGCETVHHCFPDSAMFATCLRFLTSPKGSKPVRIT